MALVYIIGASGSGKDSLINYCREKLSEHTEVLFAHRYITRPAHAGSENHIALSIAEFEARIKSDLFVMHWQSHGLHYGIGIEIEAWLNRGKVVVVNGSREYLPIAQRRFPQLIPIHVEVASEVLRERLINRGREDAVSIEARLNRSQFTPELPVNTLHLSNDGSLEQAGARLLQCLIDLTLKPACI